MRWFATLLLLAAAPLGAHRAQLSLTTVVWNAQSNSLEVTHRLHQHDLALALRTEQAGEPDFVELRARAAALVYVSERFQLSGCDSSLQDVGAEQAGTELLVYQEMNCADIPRELLVHAALLMDVLPGYVNQVNLLVRETRQTVRFDADTRARRVSLAGS